MKTILKGFLKRVIRVRVEGNINQKMTNNIAEGCHRARFYSPEAVVVVVNSTGGSLVQAKHITDIIKYYAWSNNAPIYCFAEDTCLGSANVILTLGVKCYVHEMTLLGDFNYSWSSLWLKKFADRYNVRMEYLYSGENKVKFNPFEDIRPQSQKWLQNYLYELQHDLKCTVIDQRSKSFIKNKLDKYSIEQQVFKEPIIASEQAIKVGLVDGVFSVDQLLSNGIFRVESFSGTKIYEINKREKWNKLKCGMEILG